MGYFQSKDSTTVDPAVIEVDNKIINHLIKMRNNVASSTIVNSFSDPNSSSYNASYSSQSIPLTSQCKLTQNLDISALENENPIQRRRRIMSGDRRSCYVMKLESLRQNRLNNRSNDSKHSLKLSSGIVPNSSAINNLCKNIEYSDFTTDSSKLNSSCISGTDEQYDQRNYNIPDTKETIPVKSFRDNKLISKSSNSVSNNKSGLYNSTAILQAGEELHKNLQNASYELDNWTVIVNKIKEKDRTEMRTASLPNQLDRFSLSYNPEKVFKKCVKNEDDIVFSSLRYIDEHPITSGQTNVITNSLFHKTDDSAKILPTMPDKSTTNTKQKSIFNIISLPVGFFTNCFNAGIHSASSDDCIVLPKNINSSKFDAVITIKSDYSESDAKSCFTLNENINNKYLGNNTDSKSITNAESLDKYNSERSSNTLLSYKRVKMLFQRRIAEIEKEEKQETKCRHYKELKKLRREQWHYVPFDGVKNFKKYK